MKTLIVTSMGALMLASTGISGGDVVHADSANATNLQKGTDFATMHYQLSASEDISKFAEFESIQAHIDTEKWTANVMEDNPYKRVILFSDEKGIPQYKSIYVKETTRHKLIDFHKGLLVNKVLDESAANGEQNKDNDSNEHTDTDEDKDDTANEDQDKENNATEDQDVDDFVEFDMVEEQTDIDDDQWQVVEDNDHKRVMIGSNEKGQNQFKSIFIKETNRLKVIDFNGGLVYNGILEDAEDSDSQEDQTVEEESVEIDDFVEFDIVEEQTGVDEDNMKVVENNPYKRVLLITNENGQQQFKSIFVKETNRLKIIDFQNGLLFNEVIDG
ncbi:hypothetical protein BME96_11975 [Virgibacillus halodenitrificans]|uniref:Uncharacterized protein n=1 Tax=Virgibacillus halodenitrificans TaxID=1482 RepID=A0AAC9J0F2_VIRHA|nr:hypothetical protein [Virgibacillus halodenitrificans]APC48868.1 hypothetical protein BME96_11975 [Virgibacillus halodenitrificans]CDQ36087.1 hypothetical protein BN993_05582 [Virgibacillus halodenitrificans]